MVAEGWILTPGKKIPFNICVIRAWLNRSHRLPCHTAPRYFVCGGAAIINSCLFYCYKFFSGYHTIAINSFNKKKTKLTMLMNVIRIYFICNILQIEINIWKTRNGFFSGLLHESFLY